MLKERVGDGLNVIFAHIVTSVKWKRRTLGILKDVAVRY